MKYTYDQVLNAYFAWAQKQGGNRVDEWNTYCDIRDGVPLGTNANRNNQGRLEKFTPEEMKSFIRQVKGN